MHVVTGTLTRLRNSALVYSSAMVLLGSLLISFRSDEKISFWRRKKNAKINPFSDGDSFGPRASIKSSFPVMKTTP